MAVKSIKIRALSVPSTSSVDFGVEIFNVDLEDLTEGDFTTIRTTLYHSHVAVLKNQNGLSPRAQYELTKRFDPTSDNYGHGKTLDAKRSVLHPDLRTIPHPPQVQVIGNGHYEEYEGLKKITLVHLHYKKLYKDAILEKDDLDATRYFRWHMDAALHALNPPKVTSHGCQSAGRFRVWTKYVQYLGRGGQEVRTGSQGRVLVPTSELPPVNEKDIKILLMCYKNPVTGQLALQIHPSAIKASHLLDGEIMTDLKEARGLVHRLQRPGIVLEFMYPHDWEEDDLVLLNNQGVLHTVVGAFNLEKKRLFRRCNMASSKVSWV